MEDFSDRLIVHHTRLSNQSIATFDWTHHVFLVHVIKGVKINKSGFTITQTVDQSPDRPSDSTSNDSVNQSDNQAVAQSIKALYVEEALYWTDVGVLECLVDSVACSRQELFALLAKYSELNTPMLSYHVYVKLKQSDAVVLRPEALKRKIKKVDQTTEQANDQSTQQPTDPAVQPASTEADTINEESTRRPIRATDVNSEYLSLISRVDRFVVWDSDIVSSFKRSALCKPSKIVLVANDQLRNQLYRLMMSTSFHAAVYAHLNEIFLQEFVAQLPFDFDSTIPIAIATGELNRVLIHQFHPLNDQYLKSMGTFNHASEAG